MRNQITVLGLDLGSNLGFCRSICTLRPTLHINVVDHGTICLDTLATERMKKEYNEVFSRSRVRMMIFEETVRRLSEIARFDCFVTEDVFCNPTRVNSFRALTLYMETLERIVNIEHQKRLYTVPPTLIKKHISGYGQSDKIAVQAAVLANPNITIKKSGSLGEHEADAIGCTYSFLMEYMMTLV